MRSPLPSWCRSAAQAFEAETLLQPLLPSIVRVTRQTQRPLCPALQRRIQIAIGGSTAPGASVSSTTVVTYWLTSTVGSLGSGLNQKLIAQRSPWTGLVRISD